MMKCYAHALTDVDNSRDACIRNFREIVRRVLMVDANLRLGVPPLQPETPVLDGLRQENTMEVESREDEFIISPRNYQEELLKKAKEQNTILFLPTGSGKTFVAVMLIKAMSDSVKEKFSNGGKRTFFLVNTIPLVHQNASYIRNNTYLSVGHYSGDMNVDLWNESRWRAELDDHQVLVMTTQILLNMILHDYIHLPQINLLILDECHQAVKKTAMKQVLDLFTVCDPQQTPRVLGLTATLLNNDCKPQDVKQEVQLLEEGMHSKVATIEDLVNVFCYSANPTEKIVTYESDVHDLRVIFCGNVIRYITSMIDKTVQIIDICHLESEILDNSESPPNTKPLNSKGPKWKKKLKNALADFDVHLHMLGLYGADKAALAHIIQIERLKQKCDHPLIAGVMSVVTTTFLQIRKLIDDVMKSYSSSEKMYTFSSLKAIALYNLLREFKPESSASALGDAPQDKKMCGIIFVDRRFTAKILYNMLKDLKKYVDDFKFLEPDFIVGFQNNPSNDTREGILAKKWQKEALKRFNAQVSNLLVASDVIEEGIDVPKCNLVVKFDVPKSYRSYVQSKGRARDVDGRFYLFVKKSEEVEYREKCDSFNRIEDILKTFLIEPNNLENNNGNRSPEAKFNIPPYAPFGESGPHVTMLSAIALINRYCCTLPQDKFTELAPHWWLSEPNDQKCIKAYLQLPINAGLKDIIEGDYVPNKKLAKKSVALKACKLLHIANELNDKLLPKGKETEEMTDQSLFMHWEEEEADSLIMAGTKKMKRTYDKKVPEVLCECLPQPERTSFLHVIVQVPNYKTPPQEESRNSGLFQVLSGSDSYAILSSKEIPLLCSFPVFMQMGEISVSLLEALKIKLSEKEIGTLTGFHRMLFRDLLRFNKDFLTVDSENKEHSYLIVPVKLDGDHNYIINWDIASNHQELPPIDYIPDNQRTNMVITDEYKHAIVTPWYRSWTAGYEQDYVVTRICNEMSPQSKFPAEEVETFKDYFKKKYDIEIQNTDQPLLEVKAVRMSLDCLKPRNIAPGTSRKSRRTDNDFDEHLVPELCTLRTLPGTLWMKAITIPSILHRIHHLLNAEELRVRIQRETNLPCNLEGVRWKSLECDDRIDGSSQNPSSIQNYLHLRESHSVQPCESQSNSSSPWTVDEEPVDIYREMDEICIVDILYFDDFIAKEIGNRITKHVTPPGNSGEALTDVGFQPSGKDTGPQQHEVLQALTPACAGDIVNLERLETLGDSFLKFSVSVYLFLAYTTLNEGKLTNLKAKIVGNRNLCYCGRAMGLPEIIKVYNFSVSDYIPPGFCIPRCIQKVLRDANVRPNILYKFLIPPDERETGIITHATWDDFSRLIIEESEDSKTFPPSSIENFVSQQTVSDKCVADCVEALIGAYYNAYGVRGTLRFLGWFGILPADGVEAMLQSAPPTALICESARDNINFHLKGIHELEEVLQYTFKDRSFLLQALTHASYNTNRITDCYQRLEFIGDAIIDFVVTRHIFNHCRTKLTPGQLTDLRSSLVNNITFASLTVRYEFHKYILHHSPKLGELIDQFVRFQEERNHAITDECLILMEEEECNIAGDVEVPKILGDIFESIAGAIFLDSGFSLDQVWKVYYRLMQREIATFSENVPILPVRKIHETVSGAKFLDPELIEGNGVVAVPLEIRRQNEVKQFYGFGLNKKQAKRAAAKCALKYLSS